MIFILKNKGSTLIETVLAFSVFISTVILFLSFYSSLLQKNNDITKEYIAYQVSQNEKEKSIWITEDLVALLNTVLH